MNRREMFDTPSGGVYWVAKDSGRHDREREDREDQSEERRPVVDDVLLVVGVRKVELRCNWYVLAEASQYFRDMFSGNDWKESREKTAVIPDVEPDVMTLVLKAAYGMKLVERELHGKMADRPRPFSLVPSLFIAADRFQFTELKKQCERRLVAELDEQNCVPIWHLARRFSATWLESKALSLISRENVKANELRIFAMLQSIRAR
ncbi:KLHL6 [Branchiostoma lanceolatum]|uniref:KLHL6 protein n=1 Tax=Branchiostoma lanceolatum TaxID=7740 RepID=A0A8K0A0X8_BRALA|nr:KLHL6 [Branchiostoma lanceolatum]